MSDRIKPCHLERAACVYVRQSSMGQVRTHLESQRRQYGLADRARSLGFHQVLVIDEDLGRSGTGTQERPGFARLVAALCEGTIGAVLAAEASRLARNNRDWHHLIDLCALTDALVIDHDGVYDPRLINDRLLLGLKGTMSEFELGLLRQRAQEALLEKIRRGEVLTEVPVGFVRTEDNRLEMTPDRQVQEAIRGVFAKFRELGSARQVLLWYRQERIALPYLRRATGGTEVAWRLPSYHRITAILENPTYAGAFAHGKTTSRTVVIEGRARKTRGHRVPPEQWPVLILGHHAGYITWDEYLRNREVLKNNAAMRGQSVPGPAKTGAALLAGLLRCARCGRKLHVSYSGVGGRVPRYHCKGGQINHGTARCLSFGGLRADQAVAEAILEAIQPVGIQASLDALDQAARQRDEKRSALELSLQKARYEADRARRQYDAVDPANRLVAAELEARWNAALEQVAELEARFREVTPDDVALSPGEAERLLELGRDLRTAWDHPEASPALKKRILRTVLEEIVADVTTDPAEVVLWLHWAGGTHTQLRIPKNQAGRHQRCTDRTVIDLVRELAQVCDDQKITAILNRLGYRTGAGQTWTEGRVRSLRSYHKVPVYRRDEARPWVTMEEAAESLRVSPTVIRRLLKQGTLPGRQVVSGAPWIIAREELSRPEVQAAVQAVREGRRAPRIVAGQGELPLK
jgi:DNA invertase Pin-like site-specific DNA recombinase